MVEFQRIEELGFADFVAMLLVETLDSIVAAHASQEERLRTLDETAGQDPEAFAASAITDGMIELGLLEYFPDGLGGTTIVTGGSVPSAEVLAMLGIELGVKDTEGKKLTAAGVGTVRQAIRLLVAKQNLEALQKVARQGVPRVRVDGGVLRSKLTFSAIQRGVAETDDKRLAAKAEDGPEPVIQSLRMRDDYSVPRMPPGSGSGVPPTPGRPPGRPVEPGPSEPSPQEPEPQEPPQVPPIPDMGPITGLPVGGVTWPMLPGLYKSIMDSIQKTRLTVRPADPKPPQGGEPTHESSATIFGEVEIHFHTEL